MPDPAPLELKPDELKQIRKGLEDIGETLNVAVDEQNSDIENKDEQTEKIIKDNIIDKTRIILKPDEKKRYLAISKIFIDEWMSQVKILKESEKKKGLLSGAISLVKKTGKKAWDLLSLPFSWFGKKEDKKESSIWSKILKILATIGAGWLFFGDSIKAAIPPELKNAIQQMIEAIKNTVIELMERAETEWLPEVRKWWDETKQSMELEGMWKDVRGTIKAINTWVTHPWNGLAEALGVDTDEINAEQLELPSETPNPAISSVFSSQAVQNSDYELQKQAFNGRNVNVEDFNVREMERQLEAYKRLQAAQNGKKYVEKPTMEKEEQARLADNEVMTVSALFSTINSGEISELLDQANKLANTAPTDTAANSIQLKNDVMDNILSITEKLVGFFQQPNGAFNVAVEVIIGAVERRLNDISSDIAAMNFQNVYAINYNPIYKDNYNQSDWSVKEIINDYAHGDTIDTFNITYNHVDMGEFTKLAQDLNEQEQKELESLEKQTEHLSRMVESIDGLNKGISGLNVAAEASALNMQGYTSTALPNSPFNVPNTEFLRDAQKKYAVVFNDSWKETYGGIQTT